MHTTRLIQMRLTPAEHRRLRTIAQRRDASISELIRGAVRATYVLPRQDAKKAAERAILRMNLPTIEWGDARKEIAAAHADVGRFE